MEEFSEQEILGAVGSAPDEIVDALASDELSGWAVSIGKERGLHIDKIDALGKAIVFAVLGLVPQQELFQYIMKHLEADGATVGQLMSDIDEKVFKVLRARMQENDRREAELEELLARSEEPAAAVQEEEETLDRATILRELENPTPAVSEPALVEPIPVPELPAPVSETPPTSVLSGKTGIAAGKFAAPMTMPPAARTDADTSIAALKKEADPYREPIE